jgi:glutathione S-transferase
MRYTALVTIAAVMFYFYTSWRVGGARSRLGVPAPATAGNPEFERIFRVQMNTLEWMPIFLPLLWLCAFYFSDAGAAIIGLIWIAGRIHYLIGYSEAAKKRHAGFGIQALACAALLMGAIAGIVMSFTHG